MSYLVTGLYIIAFALFIYGLMGLTGPRTAVRGNLIAAVGMAIAVGGDARQARAHRPMATDHRRLWSWVSCSASLRHG